MNSQPLRFFIVEDEQAAREGLRDLLESIPRVSVSGMAEDVRSAAEGIIQEEPDAVFLDIKLKGGDAFDLLQRLTQENVDFPPVILMTAFNEFEFAQKALNDYRHKILKLFQKPFLEDFEEQFEDCRTAILAYKQSRQQRAGGQADIIFIKQGSVTYRLRMQDVDFIEVGGSGSIIIVANDGRQLQIQQTLSSFMETAPPRIVRVHRNNAVNMDKISHVDHDDRLIFLDGHKRGISIGRTYYPAVMEWMH